MSHRVDWFFGRGLSIGCGLTWSVPIRYQSLPRPVLIECIRASIRSEMSARHVDTTDIRNFLALLAERTIDPWKHQFYTTNWDYLLQRQILDLNLQHLPSWCAQSHVYHLNGTVENLKDNSSRSNLVLESDPSDARVSTAEGETAFNKIIWNSTFVVVGMSFECEVDKYLLHALRRVEDDLPIGESDWIVVNPTADDLDATCERIQKALPAATVTRVCGKFGDWILRRVPELQALGAIR